MLLTAQTILSLILLFVGGDALVRGASALARRLGASPLAIGLTVVAFGTSAPELVVSVRAALAGAQDIAVGNVVGSNIANIALILGLAALVRPLPVQARIVRIEIPVMTAVGILLTVLLLTVGISRIAGLCLLAGLAAFVWASFRQAAGEPAEIREEFSAAAVGRRSSTVLAAGLVVGGLAGLLLGGQLLVSAAVRLAETLGVGDAVIGLTIVAVGTSLPELVTSLVASARGQVDIAVGNVVGSNVFNVVGILGTTATIRPVGLGGIGRLDLGTMLLFCFLLLFLAITGRRIDRREGAFLLLAYVAYTALVVRGGGG